MDNQKLASVQYFDDHFAEFVLAMTRDRLIAGLIDGRMRDGVTAGNMAVHAFRWASASASAIRVYMENGPKTGEKPDADGQTFMDFSEDTQAAAENPPAGEIGSQEPTPSAEAAPAGKHPAYNPKIRQEHGPEKEATAVSDCANVQSAMAPDKMREQSAEQKADVKAQPVPVVHAPAESPVPESAEERRAATPATASVADSPAPAPVKPPKHVTLQYSEWRCRQCGSHDRVFVLPSASTGEITTISKCLNCKIVIPVNLSPDEVTRIRRSGILNNVGMPIPPGALEIIEKPVAIKTPTFVPAKDPSLPVSEDVGPEPKILEIRNQVRAMSIAEQKRKYKEIAGKGCNGIRPGDFQERLVKLMVDSLSAETKG